MNYPEFVNQVTTEFLTGERELFEPSEEEEETTLLEKTMGKDFNVFFDKQYGN